MFSRQHSLEMEIAASMQREEGWGFVYVDHLVLYLLATGELLSKRKHHRNTVLNNGKQEKGVELAKFREQLSKDWRLLKPNGKKEYESAAIFFSKHAQLEQEKCWIGWH